MSCVPVEPTPITPTFLPVKSTPSFGQREVWFAATPAIDRVAKMLTAFCRDIVQDELRTARRIQAHTSCRHADAHRWLELLGFHREATLERYGNAGEDFHIYAIFPEA